MIFFCHASTFFVNLRQWPNSTMFNSAYHRMESEFKNMERFNRIFSVIVKTP